MKTIEERLSALEEKAGIRDDDAPFKVGDTVEVVFDFNNEIRADVLSHLQMGARSVVKFVERYGSSVDGPFWAVGTQHDTGPFWDSKRFKLVERSGAEPYADQHGVVNKSLPEPKSVVASYGLAGYVWRDSKTFTLHLIALDENGKELSGVPDVVYKISPSFSANGSTVVNLQRWLENQKP